VKVHRAFLAATLAALAGALLPGSAGALGPVTGIGSFQRVNAGGTGGHSSSGSGHSGSPSGGTRAHHSSWAPPGGSWNGWHHHHHDGGHFVGSWGVGFWWPYWDPWLWGWDYPYYYPPAYPAYTAPSAFPAPPSTWYYCPSAAAYYPYVAQCPEAWVPVAPSAP